MKGLDFCNDAPRPIGGTLERLTEVAKRLSERIGVYMRVDMFVDQNEDVIVSELTPNHTNGRVHCTVVEDSASGCLDPCHLGRPWELSSEESEITSLHGGAAKSIPSVFANGTDFESMCSILINTETATA